jgi:hypothetical protein
MTVAAHIVSGTGDTSHLTMDQRLSFTPEQAALRQKGTKWFMVGWYTYIGLIWTLKLNMLFLYRRVVSVGWVKTFIVPTMVFVGVTGVSIWILFASACRPFHKLWQILPDPGSRSSLNTLWHFLLTHLSVLHATEPSIPDYCACPQPFNGCIYHSPSYPHHPSSQNFVGPQIWAHVHV